MYRKKLGIVLAVLTGLIVIAASALAANAHFIGTPSATLSGNSLLIEASVAGLGNATGADATLTGSVSVSSRCYTRKGNTPQAANKQENIEVNQFGTFAVKNGRTDVSFSVSPLSTLSCPGGQHVVIESVSYDLTLNVEGATWNFTSS